MAMFQIEKGIPMPEKRSYEKKYPCSVMDVGDSFFVESKDKKEMSRISSSFATYKPKKFAARSVEGGIRVWRIK